MVFFLPMAGGVLLYAGLYIFYTAKKSGIAAALAMILLLLLALAVLGLVLYYRIYT